MRQPSLRLAAAFLASLILAACDSGGSLDLSGISEVTPVTADATVLDAAGNPQGTVPSTEPVQLSVSGLAANERVEIVITDPTGAEISPPGGFTAQADEEGVIQPSTVVQNLDLATAAAKSADGTSAIVPKSAPPGRYNIRVRRPGGQVVGNAVFNVTNDSRLFCADSAGAARGSFTSSENVFVRIERAGGTLADGTYDLYLLSDLNQVLGGGDSLGGNVREVTLSGGAALVDLGSFASGVYDVALDVNRNGTFEPATDLVSRRPRLNPCFTIQLPRDTGTTPQPIIGQICSDVRGNYRDVFDPRISDRENRDMFAYITPSRRPRGGDVLAVRKYVVQHKDAWAQGDALVDVTAGFEVDPVQGFCTNEAPWLVWPRQLFVPGCYDVVIDVNRNGVYDVGTDLLDNIDSRGEATCGCRVPNVDCADRIAITTPTANSTIAATTSELVGTVTGTPERGYATIVAGGQSNRVDLTAGSNGAFSARVPLFRGANLITVTFEYADGSACSRSVTVISDPPQAANLFRVQMTWNDPVDSDLHLIRPHQSGTGYRTGDDCYYGNCQVGFEGTDPNSIDWGLPGEGDDPKLDFDCTGSCALIENIFINEINDPDGTYTILVDQYGGTTTNTVTVFIGEVQVGQVVCPPTTDGGASDICRVGTISWTGGTTGTGTFVADGTTAPESSFFAARAKTIKDKAR